MDEVKNNNAVSKDKPEAVDHPAHYQGKHECIEVMRALFGDRAVAYFCRCNSFKYRFRADGKGGAEDIRKAEWYEEYLMNSSSVLFSEIGTYVNSAIVAALWLRVTGALDKLMDIFPEVSADEP